MKRIALTVIADLKNRVSSRKSNTEARAVIFAQNLTPPPSTFMIDLVGARHFGG